MMGCPLGVAMGLCTGKLTRRQTTHRYEGWPCMQKQKQQTKLRNPEPGTWTWLLGGRGTSTLLKWIRPESGY